MSIACLASPQRSWPPLPTPAFHNPYICTFPKWPITRSAATVRALGRLIIFEFCRVGGRTPRIAGAASLPHVHPPPHIVHAAAAAEGAAAGNTRIVTVLLIIAMSATTFLTQRQLTMKNMPPSALQGPMAQQQKVLLYVLPLIFAFSGVNFPIGVLLYWTTTNLWSMGQQFWVIRNNPQPGTPAFAAREALRAQRAKGKAAKSAIADQAAGGEIPATEETTPARVQPKKTPRSKRKGTS